MNPPSPKNRYGVGRRQKEAIYEVLQALSKPGVYMSQLDMYNVRFHGSGGLSDDPIENKNARHLFQRCMKYMCDCGYIVKTQFTRHGTRSRVTHGRREQLYVISEKGRTVLLKKGEIHAIL